MPSITYWNRLEPRARSNDLANALAARVRDPAWLLARQWQLGEFAGEDSGSPAYVRTTAELTPITAWGIAGKPAQPLTAGVPIERAATAEPWSAADVALAVELGAQLVRELTTRGAADLVPAFRAAYPIAAGAADEDPRSAVLRGVWQRRALDGIAVVAAGEPGVPAEIPAPRQAVARAAIAAVVGWARGVYGAIGSGDPAGWRPERLDYALRAYAAATDGDAIALSATPDKSGDLAWYAFDQLAEPLPAGVPAPPAVAVRRAVIPGPVKFRGMPSERFWDFEDGRVDFGGLRPDRRNLATMVLMDFMLVHGNDWFVVPFEQPVGTACRTRMRVIDVFGTDTEVLRADAAGGPWTMFSTTSGGGVADAFLVPATAVGGALDGAPREDVRFLRDETANLVWAVEHATEGPLGSPRPGADRAPPEVAAAPAASEAALRYAIAGSVPAHWIPFQPVALPPLASGQIALERAALLGPDGHVLPAPRGRVLQPAGAGPYRVREEELPREGRRITRRARWARGSDGTTHAWVARARGIGGGEGWSGLRFDHAAAPGEPGDDPT